MLHQRFSGGKIDYQPFQFGRGRLLFRGPCPDLTQPYVAVLGGAEAFGPGAFQPFADRVGQACGVGVLNLGYPAAGPDLTLGDPAMMEACNNAAATIVCAFGGFNLSNRLYRVHPRRNDRFLDARPALRALYPQTDFAGIHFTGHLAQRLMQDGTGRFHMVVAELKSAWIARMTRLLSEIEGPVLLAWLGSAPPADPLLADIRGQAMAYPPLVDQDMMDAVSVHADQVCECVQDLPLLPSLPSDQPLRPTAIGQIERVEQAHRVAARVLVTALDRMMAKKTPPEGGGASRFWM